MAFSYTGDSRDMPSKSRSAIGKAMLHKLTGPLQHCQHPQADLGGNKEMDEWMRFANELQADLCVYLHPTPGANFESIEGPIKDKN